MKKMLLKTASMALSILILLSGFPILQASADAAQTVYDLNISNVDQQTVKGWGVFPAWNRADWNRNFIDRTGAQQALFNDLGATLFRVMVPPHAGDENGNLIDAKMQEIYDLVHAGEARGMHDYILSVWSPPIGMKTLPTVNGWTGTEHVRLRTDKEDAYTDYLVNAIQWLVAKGASVPKNISFQNEPLSQIVSEWCYWGGDNGTQYQRVAKLLRSKLNAAGLTDVQILGPEGAAYYENELLLGQNFSALSNDAELYNAIGGLTSHSYFAKGYDNNDVYKDYRNVLDLFPEKDRWQTEYSTLISGVSEMDMAINAARRLAGDMALIQINYWFWWLGWAQGRHPTDVGEVLLDGDGYTVTKSKAYYVLSNIFNNVSVGSKVRRISADPASGLVTSDAVWMDAVAFVDGTKTVALLVNSTDQSKTVNVKGLTGTTASVYQLTSSVALGEDMKLAGKRNIQGGTASVIELPAKSVSVIVTSDTDTAAPHVVFDQSDSSATPNAEYAVRNSQFTVSGHLDEAGTLLINGQSVAVAGDLSFSTTVALQPGNNTISAVATDTLANQGNPIQLLIRYDPTYLGVTLDQSSLSYVKESAYTVSGRTNGSATVNIKHEHGGETVKEETYNVGGTNEGGGQQAGSTIRQIFNDNYVSTSYNFTTANGGFSTIATGAQVVRDSSATLAAAEGSYSARLKLPAGFSRIGFTFINAANRAILEDYSSTYPTAALHFWVYTRTKEDSFSAVLATENNGTKVEARIPLKNYLTASDYGNKWVKVTIPLAAFDAATHYDADGQTTEMPLMWNSVKGVGFSSQSAVFYGPNVDDVKIIYTGGGSTSPSTPLTFSTGLNLRVGDNSVTASVYNVLGQNAAPATIHVIYDPDAPVLTVPSEGSTTGTSYVLNGSVNENAVIKVNGIATTVKPDHTFTAVVPVAKGLNAIRVTAEDPAGNTSEAVVNVTADPVQDGALTPGVSAAVQTSAAPIIDGDVTETGWIVNNRVEKRITGTSDNNLTFGTMWDANNLYVAVKVLDANLKNDSLPTQTYQDDSVEIYIDGDNSRSSSYGTDDHQITLGWHDAQLSVGGGIAGIASAQKDIAGGFTVEMSIPWSGIGITPPSAGDVLGFDVAYNDDDGNNSGNRESQLMWRGNGDNWRSTSAFGSLFLNDGKNVAVALEPSGALSVDGALDDPYWALRSQATKQITGSSNNSVRFGVLGDNQNLYVGIEVLDAELKNDSTQAYQDDSVEIYLDADHNRSAAYDSKDHQITLGWHDNQISMIGNLANVQFAQKDINGGYTVEIAIPWASLNITPYRDITLGLDIGNNDDDGQNSGNRESQLMWNGTGDNWRNTSAFGNLLNHNLSLPLPNITEPEPDGLVEFIDNAGDLTKLYAKTAKIINASGHPENFSGDADRIAHNIDNPASPEYVVYQSPYGNIYSFDVTTGLFDNTPQFTISGSTDGVNFKKITAQSKLTGGANGYSVLSNKASNIGDGIKYLKVEFPGKENWKEQLLKVTFKYYGEPIPPENEVKAVFTDEAADLTKLYAKSSSYIRAVTGGQLDKYGGDNTRFIHANDDIMAPEYIVYKSPDADIYSFDINVTNWTGLPSGVDFKVFGSADGINFSQLPVSPVIVSTSSGYNTLRIKMDSVARGNKYLKVVFPYGSLAYDNWTSTINKVSFVYGVDTVPVTGVELSQTALSLNEGASSALIAAVAPENATNKEVTWSSSNPSVATVDGNGTVTGVSAGTATITVTTADGSKTAVCTVQVLPVLDQVTLTADKTALTSASTASLSISGIMSDGSQADLSQVLIVYASDNESAVKVDGSGTVTAIAEGTANVKALVTIRGVTKEGSTQIIVDNTPPLTSTIVDKTEKNGWYNSDVTVTLSAEDNLSGVDKTEYRIGDSGDWTAYTAPFALAIEGVVRVQLRSTDKAGNVEDTKELIANIDKTAPSFNLTANGSVLNEGGSFDDSLPLTFRAEDSLSGLASAKITIDGTDYLVDGQSQLSIVIDLAGKAGSHTATIVAEDEAGNKLEQSFLFTVTTGIDSIRNLVERFVNAGDLEEPLKVQLTNNLDQALHQLDIGRADQATKHLQDFVKHLNNASMESNVSAKAKEILNADAEFLINTWSGE